MNLTQDQITFNELMNRYIKDVSTLTQEQIDVVAWVTGGAGCVRNKGNNHG